MADLFLIKHPRVTEKATQLNAVGKYVFMVKPAATKNEVKKAVKELYRVDVEAVNMVTTPGKPKRFRNLRGLTPSFKKAIVTLKEGQKIDLGR